MLLVFSTIIIGGLTRLTDSGLSITKWELFTGIIPPLNESDWLKYFSLYKMIPQYELINKDMSLEDFKIIYYWEYLHRVIGRIIGLFFLIPLLYFHFSKKIPSQSSLINSFDLDTLFIKAANICEKYNLNEDFNNIENLYLEDYTKLEFEWE